MAIRIVNLRNYKLNGNEVLFKVDRSNLHLGNRFVMHGEEDRDRVCELYKEMFDNEMYKADSPIHEELAKIIQLSKTKDVALGCWCYPKRCHAETIKQFIDSL